MRAQTSSQSGESRSRDDCTSVIYEQETLKIHDYLLFSMSAHASQQCSSLAVGRRSKRIQQSLCSVLRTVQCVFLSLRMQRGRVAKEFINNLNVDLHFSNREGSYSSISLSSSLHRSLRRVDELTEMFRLHCNTGPSVTYAAYVADENNINSPYDGRTYWQRWVVTSYIYFVTFTWVIFLGN